MSLRIVHYCIWFYILSICLSCRTFYAKNGAFNKFFETKNFIKADNILEKDKKSSKSKAKLIYYLNRGIIKHLLNDYANSNKYFEIAYKIHQNYTSNLAANFFGYFFSPNSTQYPGEAHEILLIHYYKALNFVMLNDFNAALIECRRLNIELNALGDKYGSKKNIYKYDAFGHLLMGVIYQASKDYNNAFVAYRNAVEIYENDYSTLFGFNVPDQLKEDVIYTAYMAGLYEESDFYKNRFKLAIVAQKCDDRSDFVLFWHNGLGPVKDEININFIIAKGIGGLVNFSNAEHDLLFPFPLADMTTNENDLLNLQFLKIVYPRYLERSLNFTIGKLVYDGALYDLEKVEDINAISFQVLKDRRNFELGRMLLKIAIKKITTEYARNQNAMLGMALDIFNFTTEAADTRNWQTLPHSIYYKRIKLVEGKNNIQFIAKGTNNNAEDRICSLDVEFQKGKTYIQIINTF